MSLFGNTGHGGRCDMAAAVCDYARSSRLSRPSVGLLSSCGALTPQGLLTD